MRCLIRVQANHDCWIANVDGDPGRTTVKENAKVYPNKTFADGQKRQFEQKYPNRSFSVEKLNK